MAMQIKNQKSNFWTCKKQQVEKFFFQQKELIFALPTKILLPGYKPCGPAIFKQLFFNSNQLPVQHD